VRARPDARCKIIGQGATAAVRALSRAGIEVVGFVDDLRPHLASAAALVVPLRIGGGTRLKIVEGMAMGKAIVSTTLGAEGIDVRDGRELLVADDPAAFADAVLRLMNEPKLAAEMGASARRVAEERYAWTSAADKLDGLLCDLVGERARGRIH
jgi:glycosyltransferase involved in cell wall biosynthesis